MAQDLSGAQVGMTPSNPVNNPRPNNIRGRNIFPQTYKHLTTDRYGVYSPFFWAKCERGDVQNLNTHHDLHTFTLKSPMVSDVKMTKSFVKVPMQAIYPINWEKMFTIPTQGDDVPSDCRALYNVTKHVENLCQSLIAQPYTDFIPKLFLLESIASHGSLFERFNIHFNFKFDVSFGDESLSSASIDKILDSIFFPMLISLGKLHPLIDSDDKFIFVRSSDSDYDSSTVQFVSPHRFIELIRSNEVSYSDWWYDTEITDTDITLSSGYQSYLADREGDNTMYVNIEPIIAYQLSCAQFGTNDFVDYIYSADLYRQNMLSLVTASVGFSGFYYNGVFTLYDVFSQKFFDDLISDSSHESFGFFLNLFSYNNSLRYGDYFTGAKPRPLAVGEYSAEVNGNAVSAIDITKSIQMQRLLNRVNMVGRKLGDYLAGIFGGKIPEAPKDVPIFLAHQTFDVNGFETENTSDIQFNPDYENTITSHLRSAQSKHSFELEIDEPCYIIGMNSYVSTRIYSRGIDRFAFHHDRYDDFIPEMQYIGDQEIYAVELDSTLSQLRDPYAYCLRLMEYKQRVSYASGGFIENLPSWAFITDNKDGNGSSNFINPDYIRSSPSEFDRFYKSLTGYSLGSYFHFIVAHTNETAPARMMEFTPEILK